MHTKQSLNFQPPANYHLLPAEIIGMSHHAWLSRAITYYYYYWILLSSTFSLFPSLPLPSPPSTLPQGPNLLRDLVFFYFPYCRCTVAWLPAMWLKYKLVCKCYYFMVFQCLQLEFMTQEGWRKQWRSWKWRRICIWWL